MATIFRKIPLLLVLGAFCSAPLAHAIDVTAILIAIPVATGEYAVAGVLSTTALSEGELNDEAYYQALKDDAAQKVAGGATTALLEGAIQQIREQTGTKLDEGELAMRILQSSVSDVAIRQTAQGDFVHIPGGIDIALQPNR